MGGGVGLIEIQSCVQGKAECTCKDGARRPRKIEVRLGGVYGYCDVG